MSDDDRSVEGTTLDDLQSAQGFAETHFCIPQHAFGAMLLKMFDCHVDGVELFGAENNFFDGIIGVNTRQIFPTFDDGVDGFEGGMQVDFEPFAGGGIFEVMNLTARSEQDFMDVVIGKSFSVDGDGNLSVEELIIDGGGVGVIFDAFAGGALKIGLLWDADAFQSGLADFQQAFVRPIVDRKNVNDFVTERVLKLMVHHRYLRSFSKGSSIVFPFFQSMILQGSGSRFEEESSPKPFKALWTTTS